MIAGPSVISDLSTPKSDSAKLDGLAALEAKVDATTERIDRIEDTLVRQQMRSVRAIDEFQAAIGAALETLEEQQQYGSWDGLAGVPQQPQRARNGSDHTTSNNVHNGSAGTVLPAKRGPRFCPSPPPSPLQYLGRKVSGWF